MSANTFIWSFALAMPVVSGMIAFGLSTVRSGAITAHPRWEIAAGGALAILLLSVSVLLLPPQWLSKSIQQSQQRAAGTQHDREEAAADLDAIAKHQAQHIKPSNYEALEEIWDSSRKELPFPLAPMSNAEADEFVAKEIASFDEHMQLMGWHLSAARDHCELRQWDAQRGNWNSPLVVWFMRPGDPADFAEGRMSYFGSAKFRDGQPAAIASGNVLSGAGLTRLLDSMIFNRYGAEFNLYPRDSSTEPEPMDGESEYVIAISEESIPVSTHARLESAELKALPDGRFELRLFLVGETRRYVVAAEGDRASFIRQLIDDPQDPADDDGFPVTVHLLFEPENIAKHRIAITISKDRRVFSWQKAHPGSPLHRAMFMMRNAGIEKNVMDVSDATTKRSSLRWLYETSYDQMPKVKGEIRCVGKPPGEVRALLQLEQ